MHFANYDNRNTHFQSRYADWMNAQNNNDFFRASLLNEIRSTMPTKQDFNHFVKTQLGFTTQQLSEAGRILKAYYSVSEQKIWERIGCRGVQRVLEISQPEMQQMVFEKIRTQPESTRLSLTGLQKIIESCGSHNDNQSYPTYGSDMSKDRLISALSSALRENGIDPNTVFDVSQDEPRSWDQPRNQKRRVEPVCLSV
jgi:hypothetical protein